MTEIERGALRKKALNTRDEEIRSAHSRYKTLLEAIDTVYQLDLDAVDHLVVTPVESLTVSDCTCLNSCSAQCDGRCGCRHCRLLHANDKQDGE